MKRFVLAFLTIALGAAFAAPDADFAVPVIGHVYDASSHAVRRMTGTPGAATLGAGVAIGEFDKALVPGDGSFALVPSVDVCSCCGSRPPALKPAASRIRLLRSTKEH